MKNDFKNEFINECIKNRNYLGYTCDHVSKCLIGVSEQEYVSFESGNFAMSRENVERLVRLLCIKKPKKFDVNDYIDTSDLNEVELEDLTKIVEYIVGEEND